MSKAIVNFPVYYTVKDPETGEYHTLGYGALTEEIASNVPFTIVCKVQDKTFAGKTMEDVWPIPMGLREEFGDDFLTFEEPITEENEDVAEQYDKNEDNTAILLNYPRKFKPDAERTMLYKISNGVLYIKSEKEDGVWLPNNGKTLAESGLAKEKPSIADLLVGVLSKLKEIEDNKGNGRT